MPISAVATQPIVPQNTQGTATPTETPVVQGSTSVAPVDQGSQGPTTPIGQTPKTAAPAGAMATANDGWQYTGPLAEKLPQPRVASVDVWAVPGARIRIANASVLENGVPKVLKEVIAPQADAQGSFVAAYGASGEYGAAKQAFDAAPHAGMVLVSIPLEPTLDWDVRDLLRVSQQVGQRKESDAVLTSLIHYRSGIGPAPHPPYVIDQRIKSDSNVVESTSPFAVPPRAGLRLFANGYAVTPMTNADNEGGFSLQIPKTAVGAIELEVVTESGAVRLPITGKMPSPEQRIEGWQRAIRQGLLQAPQNGELSFSLDALPPGYKLSIVNPSNGQTPMVFTADAAGHLDVKVSQVYAGDALKLSGDEIRLEFNAHLTGSSVMTGGGLGWSSRSMTPSMLYTIPDASQQARIDFIAQTFASASERELHLALELFGPYSESPLGKETDPAKMQRQLYGAKLGTAFAGGVPPAVDQLIKNSGDADLLRGFQLGLGYKGSNKGFDPKTLGLTLVAQGRSRIVITGGYSPISGSHGPLRPETVTDPSVFSLAIPGLPPLQYSSGGYGPTGWVNPNAYLLTYTVDLRGGGSTWSEQGPGA